MSATSEELAAQAEQLQASIAYFRIEHTGRPAGAAPPPVMANRIANGRRCAPPWRCRKPSGQSAGGTVVIDMSADEDRSRW